jgi:hypothetical protein
VLTSAGGRTEMDDYSDYGEGSGLELVQVSQVLDYLGKLTAIIIIQSRSLFLTLYLYI